MSLELELARATFIIGLISTAFVYERWRMLTGGTITGGYIAYLVSFGQYLDVIAWFVLSLIGYLAITLVANYFAPPRKWLFYIGILVPAVVHSATVYAANLGVFSNLSVYLTAGMYVTSGLTAYDFKRQGILKTLRVQALILVAALLVIVSVWQWPVVSWAKTALTFVSAFLAGVMVWWAVGDRLLNSGDSGLAQFVGEDSILASIGTTNRGAAWAYILENLPEETNWWGQGAGHSSFLADELLGIHHPHNEYLRIFFDFGWIGVTLFLAGSIAMLLALLVTWRSTGTELSQAGLLSIVVVALMAVTDNPIVFIYVMLPAALLVSAGTVARLERVEVASGVSLQQ